MPKPFYITTAIDYTNGAPHIGHAYEKVLADVIARYHRLKGEEVYFLTGVDQHGQKVQQSAEKAGVSPQEFVDEITAKFVALWKKLEVDYTGWAETTDVRHKNNVSTNLQKLWDDKDPATGGSRWIYKKTQRGFYSVRQEQFLTDKERGPDGQFGPEWGLVEERDEENFYFRLTQDPATGLPGYDPKQWLLDFIDKRSADGKPFVVPDFRVAELRNAVEKLEGDLCISRPASRLKWGIPFPETFGAGFVTYVWFDALVNYISFAPGHDPNHGELGAGQETEFAKWWGTALHVIGKDILIPAHGVYWPIMLKAFEYPDEEIPTLLVHGWWNIGGAKMSKSEGNVVDPDQLADKYGAEALRYYLMSDISTGRDADFSEGRLVIRYNSELANSLGNLLNRTLNMSQRFRDSRETYSGWEFEFDPTWSEIALKTMELAARYRASELHADPELKRVLGFYMRCEQLPEDTLWELFWVLEHIAVVLGSIGGYRKAIDAHETDSALQITLELVNACNRLVDRMEPWKLAKQPGSERVLDEVLYALAESLRIIAILISPVTPKAAHGIFDQLNWKMEPELRGKEARFSLADAEWGKLTYGHVVGKPTPLFPRIEQE